MVVITGVVGYGGWLGYDNYVRPGLEANQVKANLAEIKLELEKMERSFQEQTQELLAVKLENVELTKLKERLETSLKLLKVDQRVAHVEVMEKGIDDQGEPFMQVRFFEVDRNNQPVGATKDFTIKGERIYIDGWIVTFDDTYVEEADELRAASLFVFKSIFGELERPADAKRLDVESESQPPGVYKSETQNEFEQKIWSDFWKVANSRELQKELGIRTSHGQANYLVGEKGQVYQVEIRASGGMSLKPIEDQ